MSGSESPRIVVLDGAPGATRPGVQSLLAACFSLRKQVFCREQGVPEELEFDGADERALHLAALSEEAVIGTVRLIPAGREARLGRLAVRADRRRVGIGRGLVESGCRLLEERGCERLLLNAQVAAVAFYEGLGFESRGPRFREAGIEHVEMVRALAVGSGQRRSG